jgi:selenide,water dikinase
MSSSSGCACKVPGSVLKAEAARAFGAVYGDCSPFNPAAQPEDCAVLRIERDSVLATVDFGPVVGRDLVAAGKISALHAFSDVYAMGGVPTHAMVMAAITSENAEAHLCALMTGVLQACKGDDVAVVGGHSIIAAEALIGLSVIGTTGPRGVIAKHTTASGQHLLLSKRIGVGTLMRAYKLGVVEDDDLASAIDQMTQSNRTSSALAVKIGVSAMTDVTGFGLLGHLAEMLPGDLGAALSIGAIPFLPSAVLAAKRLQESRWVEANHDYSLLQKRILGEVEPSIESLLHDPQTNGGLLVSAGDAGAEALIQSGLFTSIGHVTNDSCLTLMQ